MRRLTRIARLRRAARGRAAARGIPPAAAVALLAFGGSGAGYLDRGPLAG
jgi:hypothetical protein